jgi:GT2 family glycosyltransferase
MRVLVVVLNYKSAPLTVQCLATLAGEVERHPDTCVLVPDNASGDGSVELLRAEIARRGWAAWAHVLPHDRNDGYGAGNNVAIRAGLSGSFGPGPEYVWLLNPDTLVRPGALGALLAFLDAHPDVGIAGSRLEEEDGTQHASRYRFPTVWSELESGFRLGIVTRLLKDKQIMPPLTLDAHPIDWVAGASMMLRRTTLDAVGLFDEGYFLYYEEVDLCRRARLAGWPCWYVPDSRVAHLVGQSSGVTAREKAIRRPRYWFESRRRYFVKHHGRIYAFLCDVAWATGFGLWRIRRRLQRKPDLDPPHLWWDFVRFNLVPFGGGGRGRARTTA